VRPRSGPALRSAPLPFSATLLSAVSHGALAAVVLVSAHLFTPAPSKTYVVNLVPAVAAVGTPQGRPAVAPRPEEPPPRVSRRTPAELPAREAPRAPSPPPELPARAPSLPEVPSRASSLPDRTPIARPPAAARTGEKELPPMASTAPPAMPSPAPTAPTVASRPEPPAPPPTLGQRSGSAQGSGAVTLNVTDFPFAWYLRAVQSKVTERWEGNALQGRQPVVIFEINRDGQVSNVTVKESSGNRHYDFTAMRAISQAAPFPKLPDEWPRPSLVIQMGFNFAQDRG
jgi:TonB family protein